MSVVICYIYLNKVKKERRGLCSIPNFTTNATNVTLSLRLEGKRDGGKGCRKKEVEKKQEERGWAWNIMKTNGFSNVFWNASTKSHMFSRDPMIIALHYNGNKCWFIKSFTSNTYTLITVLHLPMIWTWRKTEMSVNEPDTEMKLILQLYKNKTMYYFKWNIEEVNLCCIGTGLQRVRTFPADVKPLQILWHVLVKTMHSI